MFIYGVENVEGRIAELCRMANCDLNDTAAVVQSVGLLGLSQCVERKLPDIVCSMQYISYKILKRDKSLLLSSMQLSLQMLAVVR